MSSWKLFSVLLLAFKRVRIIILALSSRILTCFYSQGSLGDVHTCGDFWSRNIKARSQGMMEVSQINIMLKEQNIWKKRPHKLYMTERWESSLDKHLHWVFREHHVTEVVRWAFIYPKSKPLYQYWQSFPIRLPNMKISRKEGSGWQLKSALDKQVKK